MNEVTDIFDAEQVNVTVPADIVYISTIRSCAGSIGVRCDLTIDAIEDLRLAVSEACGILLSLVEKPSSLRARFVILDHTLGFEATVVGPDSQKLTPLDQSGLGWVILTALVSELDSSTDEGSKSISFSMLRESVSC